MSIQLIIGPMFSGKTENLLTQISKISTKEYILIKHFNDVRYSANCVESHSGVRFPAVSLKKLDELNRLSDEYRNSKVIAVDEGHFFPDITEHAHQWALHGKLVLITAIQTGMFMEALPNISCLLSKAEKIVTMSSYCSHCTAQALFSYRKTPIPKAGNEVERFVGGSEDYTTLCRICFHKRIRDDCEKELGLFSDEAARIRAKPLRKFDIEFRSKKEEEGKTLTIPTSIKNTIEYLFTRVQVSRAPFEPHKNMLKLEETEFGVRTLKVGSWFVGLLKDDCRTRWILTLEEHANISQKCRPSQWSGCLICPSPFFEACDLTDPDLNETWGPGSICIYDTISKERSSQ